MPPLAGSVILVTGAAGFVGAHLTRALAARGAIVHGLGSEPPRAPLPLAAWHAADLRAPESLSAAVAAARPDFVAHLAGQASAGRSFEHPLETFQINALGTWHLLEAVRTEAPAARVMVVTSGEVYGPQALGTRVGEGAGFAPVSPYALSKAAADALAEVQGSTNGLAVVRARSFAHAGPGQDPRFALPSWAKQIAAIEAGRLEPVIRVGNLDVTRDLSDARDVVRAYEALLERGHSGAAYNVCRGAGVKLADALALLTGMARVPVTVEVDPARTRAADVPYLVGDPTAIERDTGWRPAIALERTLADLLEDWRGREAE